VDQVWILGPASSRNKLQGTHFPVNRRSSKIYRQKLLRLTLFLGAIRTLCWAIGFDVIFFNSNKLLQFVTLSDPVTFDADDRSRRIPSTEEAKNRSVDVEDLTVCRIIILDNDPPVSLSGCLSKEACSYGTFVYLYKIHECNSIWMIHLDIERQIIEYALARCLSVAGRCIQRRLCCQLLVGR
jgi:hypothetical protein